jgi:predicted nucleotidyltransferase
MNPLVAAKQEEIAALCRLYRVRQLELFGSATGKSFDSGRSDLDFLVTFGDLATGQYADAYFGLWEGLEALFGRHIDLVAAKRFANPYFQQAVDATRTPVYAA